MLATLRFIPVRKAVSIVNLRRLSGTAGEKQAKEVSGGLLKWFKKYAIIIVPGTIMSIVSVDIINNTRHRGYVEEIAPFYVQFVRDKYGFSDENAEERAHQKALQQFLKSEISVVAGLDQNRVISPAQQSIKEVAAKVSGAQEPSIVDIYSSNLFEFEDSAVEDTNQQPSSSSSSPSALIINPVINSLWEPWLTSIDRDALQPALSIYENFILRPWAGISVYREYGSGSLPVFPVTGKAKERLRDSDYRKRLALEEIRGLEKTLQALQRERLYTMRDMDSLDREISLTKAKIVELKRKHLNYFYYF